jgi:hypothetical protein
MKKRVAAVTAACAMAVGLVTLVGAPSVQAVACCTSGASVGVFEAKANVHYVSCCHGATRSYASAAGDSGWYAGSMSAYAG